MKRVIIYIQLLIVATIFSACKKENEKCSEESLVGTYISSKVMCNGNPANKRNVTIEKTNDPEVFLMSIEDNDSTLQVKLSDCTFSFDHNLYNAQAMNPEDTLSTDSIFLEIRYHGTGELNKNSLTLKFNTDVSQSSNNPMITLDNITSTCEYNASK